MAKRVSLGRRRSKGPTYKLWYIELGADIYRKEFRPGCTYDVYAVEVKPRKGKG